jgi:hypothetical protein
MTVDEPASVRARGRLREENAAYAVGDRVHFHQSLPRQGVSPGMLGTVVEEDGARLRVRLDSDGRAVVVDTQVYRALDHGYALQCDLLQAQELCEWSPEVAQGRPALEQAELLQQLERVLSRPTPSLFEAVRTLPEVVDAHVNLREAEEHLESEREPLESLPAGFSLTPREKGGLRTAMQAVEAKRAELALVLRRPSLERRAGTVLREYHEHRARCGRLQEAVDRARAKVAHALPSVTKVERLLNALQRVNEYQPQAPIRLATQEDVGLALRYLGPLEIGEDLLLVCRDARGRSVAVDAERVPGVLLPEARLRVTVAMASETLDRARGR